MRIITKISDEDWSVAVAQAKHAEAIGFDGVSTSELAHDVFMPLALAAMATERVDLLTSIAISFPRSPMIMANIAWDLQANSGGRMQLGLGSQVKGHNERRFSVPWTSPVPRMREYIQSLRAIWRCWEKGEKLDFQGEHYQFTLMTPEFSPKPTGLPMVPVTVAAVGPDMLRMAGRIADGVRLHSFCTPKYIKTTCMPKIEEGMAKGGQVRENLEIFGGGFIATGRDEDEVRKALDYTRYRVAFYGSTRTYWPVLEQHGLEDLGARLHDKAKKGQWDKMAEEVSDEVVHLFTAVAPLKDLPKAIEDYYGGVTDVIRLEFAAGTPEGLQREVLQDLKKIPTPFKGFKTGW